MFQAENYQKMITNERVATSNLLVDGVMEFKVWSSNSFLKWDCRMTALISKALYLQSNFFQRTRRKFALHKICTTNRPNVFMKFNSLVKGEGSLWRFTLNLNKNTHSWSWVPKGQDLKFRWAIREKILNFLFQNSCQMNKRKATKRDSLPAINQTWPKEEVDSPNDSPNDTLLNNANCGSRDPLPEWMAKTICSDWMHCKTQVVVYNQLKFILWTGCKAKFNFKYPASEL